MNKKEFGALVRALREDHLDQNANKWTRKKLSEAMSSYPGIVLDDEAIGKIERGQRKNITSQELVAFANALQLTSVEREAFFQASLGTDDIFEKNFGGQTPDQILKKLVKSLQGTRVPFFICDQFNDIVAANRAIVDLLQFTPELIQEAVHHPIGLNALRIVFDPELGFRKLVSGELWNQLAFFEIQWFRGDTLQYRNSPYFKYLLKYLLKYREFRWRWREVYWEQEDWYGHYQMYCYAHPKAGDICYGAIHSRALTPVGPLVTIMYIPHTVETSIYFESLMQNGGANIQLFPTWPDKNFDR